MSCFSCERSPIHARWHVFQAKSIGVMLFTLFTTLFCLALGSPTSARDCTACVRVENMTITVSTDGSALGNPNGPMGWAWADHEQNAGGKPGHKHDDHGYDAGGATNGTNQIGELCAVLEALRAHPGPEPLLIESDSQYAINCSTKWVKGWKKNGWKNSQKKPVKNKELIQAIDREISHALARWISDGSKVTPATKAMSWSMNWHAPMRAIAVRVRATAIYRLKAGSRCWAPNTHMAPMCLQTCNWYWTAKRMRQVCASRLRRRIRRMPQGRRPSLRHP